MLSPWWPRWRPSASPIVATQHNCTGLVHDDRMPVRLDEYLVHQVPLSMRYPATSDRNFYDRCYFNAHDRTGDVFLVTGLGVYPNLGVIDAFVTVRRGPRQITVRASDAMPDDRTEQVVGPFRFDVVTPLEEIAVRCEHEVIDVDLTWHGSFPAVEEPPHVVRQGGKILLDAMRFAQVGTWSGEVTVGGDRMSVSDDRRAGQRPSPTPASASGGRTRHCVSTTSRSSSSPRRTATANASSAKRGGCGRPRAGGRPSSWAGRRSRSGTGEEPAIPSRRRS